jgi:CHAT domain
MIKILFLAANPAGTTPLALDEEIRAIDGKLRGSAHRDHIELASHWAIRLDDLSGILMRHRPDVVHFSGHGARTGDICLVGFGGAAKRVAPEALAGLFRVLKDNVRVVVFNACHSVAQAKAVAREVGCAVGMSRAIDDEQAIAFAAEFYQALGFGKSVADAYELAIVRLIGEGVADSRKLAKLYKRRGINPVSVVLLATNPEASPLPPPSTVPDRGPTHQATSGPELTADGARPPRVFVSYSWEDEAHTERL